MRGARVKMLRDELRERRPGFLVSEWRRFKRAWTREGWAGLEIEPRKLPGAARPPGI